ncbi:MFS transporter [Bacillus sp. B-jedd]|uniref:MFS transporter n=1 Tax=Bacillus sp. B-jedd TaxID=1476857 RepID=UPI0005157102|nr:MFS transporter [Bacillus sp. B-jedd]CEG27320.1 Major Facilitator Superfamily protein [Bacillus sp. B-jedd]
MNPNHRPEIVQLNEKYSIKSGIASTVVLNLTNNYYSLFAISVLGATNYQVGLISSLPQFIGMFAMFICSILMGRLSEKKKFTAYSVLFTRFFLLLMFFVIYVPEGYQSWVFVILVGLMNFPGSFAIMSWQSFIGDIIPDHRRNGFFSERNKLLTIVGMIATLTIGLGLRFFDIANPLPYQLLFLFAFLFGAIEVYYIFKHRERPGIKKEKSVRYKIRFSSYTNKPYLFFLISGLYFNFGWQMAWPLFSIYQISYAHANGFWISLFTVANQVAQIASFTWWGRMADKHGNTKMMILVALGMAIAPVTMILSTNLIYLTIANGLSGFFVSGTVLVLFNQLLDVTKEETRTAYIANYNVLLAIIGFIAPQFGVFLLEASNIEISMSISTAVRATSAVLFFLFYLYMKRGKSGTANETEVS